ncbi:UNVERIFIED_ORG: putative MFS family arabinose efflux permease [Agrobacterium larrymoorei]|nr:MULTISPECIES: MFS transporter [Rhizobium/Agrobacterium group]MDP9574015.1 putative MFS family arabinose efflux permease [Agrobacterium larrymoorei]
MSTIPTSSETAVSMQPGTVDKGQFTTLAGLSALYVGFGMTMGVIQGGFPTVMRAAGMSIGSAGWLYALYLPFGVAFLWSPLIDRWRPPVLTPRIGWIVPLQILAALIVCGVAFMEGAPIVLLFALGFLVACAMATMDIALDGLAVDLVMPVWRPNAAAAKLAALSMGAMIGTGAFVALFQHLGWLPIFLGFGGVLLLLTLPVLALIPSERTLPRREGGDARSGKASLTRVLAEPLQRKRLMLLTFACCVIFPLSGLNRLMLVDLGLSVETIGWVVGTLGPVAMFVTALISMPLMQRTGLAGSLIAFTALGLAALTAMAAGFQFEVSVAALTGTILIGAAVSGIYVALTARILGWASGQQPATDYAVFYGAGRLASTIVIIAAAQFIAHLGWPLFYGLGAVGLIVVFGLVHGPVSERT